MTFVKGVSGNPNGRPRKQGDRRKPICFKLLPEEIAMMKKIAEREEKTVTGLMRKALNDYYLSKGYIRPRDKSKKENKTDIQETE